MQQYQVPLRNNNAQVFVYTFKDQSNTVIDLTNAVLAFMEVKLYGQLYATIAATINLPPSAGVVQASYMPTVIGIWTVQFYTVDGLGNKLYGEPLQITVVPNVDDLALSQLAKY
jgi:hypothetical protein